MKSFFLPIFYYIWRITVIWLWGDNIDRQCRSQAAFFGFEPREFQLGRYGVETSSDLKTCYHTICLKSGLKSPQVSTNHFCLDTTWNSLKRASVHFDRYGYPRIWALDKKLFTGFIYSSQYTIKIMFHNPGNFCNYKIFELLLLKKILSSN